MSPAAGSSKQALEKEEEALWEAEEDRYSDWEEEIDSQAQSFFDPNAVFPRVSEALAYDRSHFQFDLVALAQHLRLDGFGCIKLVNYLRASKLSPDQANALTDASVLDDDTYFKPVIEDDALLQLDFDELLEEATGANNTAAAVGGAQQSEQSELDRLREAYEHLKLAYQNRIEAEEADSASDSDSSSDSHQAPRRSSSKKNIKKKPDHDSHYFQSYSENEIHEVMLSDKLRTESYRAFIVDSGLFKDAVVLDVGCGTGILSMFAAEAGAKHVYAVDASDIAIKALANVHENGLDQKITVVRGKVEDVQLPGAQQVDIIVSEWMGYFCLYESMLDSVLVARNRFLRPGGLIAPSQCTMYLCAIDNNNTPAKRKTFWNEQYGYKMSAMGAGVFDEAQIDLCEASAVISDTMVLKDVHILPLQAVDLDRFTAKFKLTIAKSGEMGGFCSYFDTFFTTDGRSVNATNYTPTQGEVTFSTCPGPKGETHWKQTSFMFEEPLQVQQGDIVEGTLEVWKSEENPRELKTKMNCLVGQEQIDRQWAVR